MDEIKPEHYITEKQCQEMIDKAIDKHNKTATVISAILGGILLAFYSHGVLSFCLLYTSPSPRDRQKSRMPSSA